ncbi:hypothetical protein GUJ93_ZPchr0005g14833 [Zizania palustris]|uniref:Uncharacterized protein n=1 Tax=Zizania palustris TaxID=103762 RepID=A0A8J5SHR2_ZIZPA|nr:hypothetical protein GUJ93_ZPchr0005g14833 [Zizania palustris]
MVVGAWPATSIDEGGVRVLIGSGVPVGFVGNEVGAKVRVALVVTVVRSVRTEGDSGDGKRWLERRRWKGKDKEDPAGLCFMAFGDKPKSRSHHHRRSRKSFCSMPLGDKEEKGSSDNSDDDDDEKVSSYEQEVVDLLEENRQELRYREKLLRGSRKRIDELESELAVANVGAVRGELSPKNSVLYQVLKPCLPSGVQVVTLLGGPLGPSEQDLQTQLRSEDLQHFLHLRLRKGFLFLEHTEFLPQLHPYFGQPEFLFHLKFHFELMHTVLKTRKKVHFDPKFKTSKLCKYSGDEDPEEFSRSHALAIEANRGVRDTMANCFLRWHCGGSGP